MKKTLLAAAAGLVAMSLTACGSGGNPSTSPSSGGSNMGAGKTLSVWIMEGTNPDSTAFFNDVKTAFKSKTGADLDIQMVPWASAKDKFTTAIAGGTTPDVAEVGTTWTPEFAQAGALVDLSERVKKDKLDTDLVQGLVEAGTLDGKLYGMPWYAGVRAFLYNKDVFKKAGITSDPKNWNDLAAAVDKIKATQPDVTPWPIPGDSEFLLYPFIWGNGGSIATQQGDKWQSQINSDKAVEAITWYTDMALKHGASNAAATTWNEKDLLKAFETGKTGMVIQGSWTPTTIVKDAPEMKDKIGAFVIPGKDSGIAPSFLGGSHLGIFNNSKNQDLAWEFVKLMTTGDYAAKWGKEANYFPGQKSLLDAQIKSGDALTKVFANQMVEAGKSTPVTPLWGAVQGKKVTPTMLQAILSGKQDAKTAADQAAKSMDETFQGK